MQPAHPLFFPYFFAAHRLQADQRRREAGIRAARARRRRLSVLRTLFRPTPTRLPASRRAPVTARHAALGS